MSHIDNFKTKVSRHLAENKYTLTEFERSLGLKPQTLKNILNGNTKNPSLHVLVRVSEALDLTINDLLEDHDQYKSLEFRNINIASKYLLPFVLENGGSYRDFSNLLWEALVYGKNHQLDAAFIAYLKEKFLMSHKGAGSKDA